ncbi:MAG: tetratricopeptide repeat protein [Lentisphaerae bacterium]|nr:tetratricopeptide repeat protein [Lentisphaerota bacterium]
MSAGKRVRQSAVPASPPRPATVPSRATTWIPAALIAVACALAYANSFHVPFICDDAGGIVENPTIRKLWPPMSLLHTPRWGNTLEARPIANFTLALNYAANGLNVTGYHVVNLIIHVLVTLALFGFARRTLRRPCLPPGLKADAAPLAFVIALVWALHPLHTQVVTYIVQRVESLMALFYLLTLYGVARAGEADALPSPGSPPRMPRRALVPSWVTPSVLWSTIACCACTLGMATKEVMLSAPVVALAYDRIFLAGSWRELLRRRWGLHLGLVATWGILAAVQLTQGGMRNPNTGFGSATSPWQYLLTQSGVILHYLKQAFWPLALSFDYRDWPLAQRLADVWPSMLAVTALLTVSLIGLRRAPAMGFLGLCFFAILAPTSSLMPIDDLAQERRMYLPMAALVAALVVALHQLLAARVRHAATTRYRLLAIALPLALALGVATFQRNRDYRTELSLWMDTLQKRPNNAQAAVTAGAALLDLGRIDEALALCQRAIRIKPDYAMAYNNLGLVRYRQTNYEAAVAAYDQGLAIPDLGRHTLLGNRANARAALGQVDLALEDYAAAIAAMPMYAGAYRNRARLLAHLGRHDDAMRDFANAIRYAPERPDAYVDRGNLLASLDRPAEAVEDFSRALRLAPAYADAYYNRANCFAQLQDYDQALQDYSQAIRHQPGKAEAFNNRASVYLILGDAPRARQDIDACRQLGLEPNSNLVSMVNQALASPPSRAPLLPDPH